MYASTSTSAASSTSDVSTTCEFLTCPRLSESLEDELDLELGMSTPVSLAFEHEDDEGSGSDIYPEYRIRNYTDRERAAARARTVRREFGGYPCNFGSCREVLNSRHDLTCHLHIHYLAMELPEERGLPTVAGEAVDLTEPSTYDRLRRTLRSARIWLNNLLSHFISLVDYVFNDRA